MTSVSSAASDVGASVSTVSAHLSDLAAMGGEAQSEANAATTIGRNLAYLVPAGIGVVYELTDDVRIDITETAGHIRLARNGCEIDCRWRTTAPAPAPHPRSAL